MRVDGLGVALGGDVGLRMELRRADYSLNEEQRALRDTFKSMLLRDCPGERVRRAEPLGFDGDLWQQFVDMGAVAMGVPSKAGGDGAGLVELALVAEEVGRALAPVPFIECAVSARLLAQCDMSNSDWLDSALSGKALVTLALHPIASGRRQLVHSGAVANAIIGFVGAELVISALDQPLEHVENQACAPLACWDMGQGHVAALGAPDTGHLSGAFLQAQREWKLLMAAAQVGVADGALRIAVEFARTREAFGVPISTFQGVSHPLATCLTAIVGARRLVWKAAWYADNEPDTERHLIPMAFLYACRAGNKAATVGIHTQGGLGFTMDSDLQMYFRRAKGWANVGGDPAGELDRIADALYGPISNLEP